MNRLFWCAQSLALVCVVVIPFSGHAGEGSSPQVSADDILTGLRAFYKETARSDGSFQAGIDPQYLGMSDSAYSDLAAVTYACTIHKTFGWKLPDEGKTIEFLQSRQRSTGEFFNVAGTVDPASAEGQVYNTTQALVALHALGVAPKYDPLPIFEAILRQDYKTLPAYSTSFFPLAYLCAGKPIPEQADRAIRALMIQDEDGYLNDHIAATFHASHYYALVGDPTPKASQMVDRTLRDQRPDGSWLLNLPARDRHATFDAVFTLRHEGADRADCKAAIKRAARWAISCRNADGGFGHYPGSTSDADAVYFQVGTLVMAGVLSPTSPLPSEPGLLSWGHLMPVTERPQAPRHRRLHVPGWVGGVTLDPSGRKLVSGSSDGVVRVWDTKTRELVDSVQVHTGPIASVALSSGGKWMASGGHDQTVVLQPMPWGGDKRTLVGHRGGVTCVAFSDDESRLATGGIDGSVVLWDVATGERRRVLRGHKSWINAVALVPQKKQVISASSDGAVKIWSAEDGELQQTLGVSKAEVRAVAVSPDGKWLAAGVRYGTIKVWNTDGYKLVHTLESSSDDVNALVFEPDGTGLLAALGRWNRPSAVQVWDVRTGETAERFQHTGEVLSLAVSADGSVIAAGGGDHAISVWRRPRNADEPR